MIETQRLPRLGHWLSRPPVGYWIWYYNISIVVAIASHNCDCPASVVVHYHHLHLLPPSSPSIQNNEAHPHRPHRRHRSLLRSRQGYHHTLPCWSKTHVHRSSCRRLFPHQPCPREWWCSNRLLLGCQILPQVPGMSQHPQMEWWCRWRERCTCVQYGTCAFPSLSFQLVHFRCLWV